MKIFGWIYVIAFSLDAAIAVAASFDMDLESLSNQVSAVVMLLTIGTFILSCINKLRPRKLFFTLCGFYFAITIFGLILGVLLVAKNGAQAIPEEGLMMFLGSQFDWYWPVHWIVLNLWCLLAVFGLTVLYRPKDSSKQPGQH